VSDGAVTTAPSETIASDSVDDAVGSDAGSRVGSHASSHASSHADFQPGPRVVGSGVPGQNVGGVQVDSGEPSTDPYATGTARAHPGTPCDVRFPVDRRFDLAGSVGVLRRSVGDPTFRVAADGAIWLGCRIPSNEPGTLRLFRASLETVEAQAWGPGAAWLLESVPGLLGLHDSDETRTEFADLVEAVGNPVLVAAARRHRGFRVIRSGRVFDELVPSVLEQKVQVVDARRSYRVLVRKYGEPAPGPHGSDLYCPPTPRGWAVIPSWEWRRAGVDGKRSQAIVSAVRVASRLEETVGMDREEAARRIRTVPGIGVWTAAEIMHRSHGDADAVSVGDLHLPRVICSALGGGAAAGRGADDEKMLAELEPYRGHRYRVTALLYR
jgi:3-methyladenine DNA glycosylase/8-oxoguanine DNA glycosylase